MKETIKTITRSNYKFAFRFEIMTTHREIITSCVQEVRPLLKIILSYYSSLYYSFYVFIFSEFIGNLRLPINVLVNITSTYK